VVPRDLDVREERESRGGRGDVKNVGGMNERCRERGRRREDEREEDGAAL
jgi:hypothetical protein